MCAAAASIKKQLLQAFTLPVCLAPRRRWQARLRPQRWHFDEQGGPSVRYYQQFVLRSHTFHASYLLQHYYIAATCRSEPLSKMSSLQEGAVRLHLQWSKLKKKTSSDLSTVVVTDCKIYDYMYINPQWHITWWCIVKRTFSSSIKQHSWNRHSFFELWRSPKKENTTSWKRSSISPPLKKETKIYPSLTNTRR